MADEYLEHDLDTPTEEDLNLAFGSQYLSKEDVGGKKLRTRIAKVRKKMVEQGDGKGEKLKFLLFFDTVEKPLILNATNKDRLIDGVSSKKPASWVGTTVGLYVDPDVSFGGKRIGGLRLKVLEKPPSTHPAAGNTFKATGPSGMKPKAEPEPDDTTELDGDFPTDDFPPASENPADF